MYNGWMGNPDGGVGYKNLDAQRALAAGYERISAIYSEVDGGWDWEARGIAVLDGVFYFVTASGCSCTDAAAEWEVAAYGTAQDIASAIVNGDYRGYTIGSEMRADMLAALEIARK